MNEETEKRKIGFAVMPSEAQREIASQGGKKAHLLGTAHKWNVDEARTAGMKGGLSVSKDREHMRRIGRLGALKAAQVRRERNSTPTTEVKHGPEDAT